MPVLIHITSKENPTEFGVDEFPRCPKCGSKAFISKDVADGFYFGWSVGCPRFHHYDGIHGTDIDTPEKDTYAIHNLNSKEECIEKWKERVRYLEQRK